MINIVKVFVVFILILLTLSVSGCTITHKHLVEGEADQNVYVIVTGNIPIDIPSFNIEEVN